VVDLAARTPGAGHLPVRFDDLNLREVVPDAITAVMPFEGRQGAVAKDIGLPFPAPGRITQSGEVTAIWAGSNLALVLNATPRSDNAAISDQSDAWAVFDLTGPGIDAVMARLCPVDTRVGRFPPGHTARTLLGHMNASVTRLSQDCLRIMVFRSMAQTAVHEITRAMEHAVRHGVSEKT